MLARMYKTARFHRELAEFRRLAALEGHCDRSSYQLAKLERVLQHAYDKTPYYHSLLSDSGLIGANGRVRLSHLSDLKKLPILTKDTIRNKRLELTADDVKSRGAFLNASGGSTGEPVTFLQDRSFRISAMANFWLSYHWNGVSPMDKELIVWGAERDIFAGRKTIHSILRERLNNFRLLNSFRMSDETMENYLAFIAEWRADVIRGYVQSLAELARFAQERNIIVPPQKVIHCAAGTLYPFQREAIKNVFGGNVYNFYGSREVSGIATERRDAPGLQVLYDNVVLELEGTKDPKTERYTGEIIITTLNNYSMPLVRYMIGDIGYCREKPSDNGVFTLDHVAGRSTDIFRTLNGERIDGEYFTHLFYFLDGVKKFQVLQNNLEEIEVLIIKNSEIDERKLQDVVKKIKLVMGHSCQVNLRYVSDIPKTETGKHLYTISRLVPDPEFRNS